MNKLLSAYASDEESSPIIQSTNQQIQTPIEDKPSDDKVDQETHPENKQVEEETQDENMMDNIENTNKERNIPIQPEIREQLKELESIQLPPIPTGNCDPNLQAKISEFIKKHREGLNLNEDLKKQKQFSNPEILEKIVEAFDIKQYGTQYSNEIWDPYNLPEEDYYDKIYERKETFGFQAEPQETQQPIVERIVNESPSPKRKKSKEKKKRDRVTKEPEQPTSYYANYIAMQKARMK